MIQEPRDNVAWLLLVMAFAVIAFVLALLFSYQPAHAEGQVACYQDTNRALKVIRETLGMKPMSDGLNEKGALTHLLVNPQSGQWAYVLEIPGKDTLCIIDEGRQFSPHFGEPV